MKLLVTGASGFIGQHFVRLALARGATVKVVTRAMGGMQAVPDDIIRDSDAVVHFAAHGVVRGGEDWDACFRVNLHESLMFWRRAANGGVRRFVICGSCFEYGLSGERYDAIPVDAPLEPTGAYHASKAAASMAALGLCREKKLELAILRPFHVFGEGEAETRLWPALRRAASSGVDFDMSPGGQVRDFVPVQMVAEAFWEKATSKNLLAGIPVVENIGTGYPQTIREFAEHWWRHWGAVGSLKLGVLPYRKDEVMHYVPAVRGNPSSGSGKP